MEEAKGSILYNEKLSTYNLSQEDNYSLSRILCFFKLKIVKFLFRNIRAYIKKSSCSSVSSIYAATLMGKSTLEIPQVGNRDVNYFLGVSW